MVLIPSQFWLVLTKVYKVSRIGIIRSRAIKVKETGRLLLESLCECTI